MALDCLQGTSRLQITTRENTTLWHWIVSRVHSDSRSRQGKILHYGIGLSPGYIQTPDQDKGKYYIMALDTWASIAPPLHHVTIVSIRRLALPNKLPCGHDEKQNILELFDGDQDREHRMWAICGTTVPPPTVFHAHVVYVHLKLNTFLRRLEGTQLAFTHHLVWKRALHCPSCAVQSASFSVFMMTNSRGDSKQ